MESRNGNPNLSMNRPSARPLPTARNGSPYGRDYSETHFSPLKQIDASNVQQLGLIKVWPTSALGALEATPLVQDGILYGTVNYGIVFAFDLRTGERIWQCDPEVSYENRQKAAAEW